MSVLGSITPVNPSATIVPGTVITFNVTLTSPLALVGSTMNLTPNIPAGWTAVLDPANINLTGIISSGTYSVSYTITGTGTDTPTSGTFNLGISYFESGINTTDTFTTSTMPVTIGVAAPSAPILAIASDTGVLGDGITSVITPTVTGTGIVGATVTLLDTDGTTVLGTGLVNGSGNWSISSAALAEGSHTLTTKQNDGSVTSGASASLVLTVDATVPVAPSVPVLTAGTDTGSSNSDGITSNTSPIFTGTGEIGSTVKLFDASNGNALIGSATVDGAGHYNITPTTPLTAGAHSVYAQASDAAANTSAVTSNLAVIIDNVAPTAILLPTSTVYISSGPNALVSTLGATDTTGGGPFSYQLVPGVGADNNADFSLLPTGELRINDPALSGVGTESIRVRVTDAAGNSFSQVLAVNVATAPPPAPPAPSTPTVDGVPVTSASVTLPSGSVGTMVTVPVVSSSAGGVTGAPNVADIPLVTSNSASLLLAQVPIGMGLTATGGISKPAGNSLAELIAAIKGQTATHTTADQSHLTGNGTQFVSLLASDVPLLVNTVVVNTMDAKSVTPLTLTGTSTSSQHTALVIDTSQLPGSSNIVLNNVDFAAVVGAVTITGTTAGQIITGDLASQTIIVSSGTPSQVYAGGGNDVLQYGLASTTTTGDAKTTSLVANSSTAGGLSAATAVLLNGGTGSDTALFSKAQSAYSIDQRDGYILVTDKSDTRQQITVTNTESLKFSDGVVNVQSRGELTTLAGLYQTAFGRQADIGGFDYWGAAQAKGVSLGTIAVNMLGSDEAVARGFALNGDAGHDITVLYKAVFGRNPDANGLAYWQNQMAHGQSIVDVANGFMAAPEITEHKLAVTGWDMTF